MILNHVHLSLFRKFILLCCVIYYAHKGLVVFHYLMWVTWLTILSVFLSTWPADLVPSYGHLQSVQYKSFPSRDVCSCTCNWLPSSCTLFHPNSIRHHLCPLCQLNCKVCEAVTFDITPMGYFVRLRCQVARLL